MTTIKIGDPVKILAGQGDTSYCGLEANMYRFKGELAEVISFSGFCVMSLGILSL
jgi:hypothetical protein